MVGLLKSHSELFNYVYNVFTFLVIWKALYKRNWYVSFDISLKSFDISLKSFLVTAYLRNKQLQVNFVRFYCTVQQL